MTYVEDPAIEDTSRVGEVGVQAAFLPAAEMEMAGAPSAMTGADVAKPEEVASSWQRPTIRDVARAAGVAVGTASKALSGQGKLRPETRARVRAEAERLGFYPNDLVHSILRGRTYTVGLVTTESNGRFSAQVLLGIEHALAAAQISVFVCLASDDPARERQHIASLLAKQVDGIIVMGDSTDPRPPIDVGNARVPVLYAYTSVADPAALCLLPDDGHGARLATEHLLAHGRRRLAHITGPSTYQAVGIRLREMRAVLAGHGLPLPDTYIRSGSWQQNWGYESMDELLQMDSRIDAVFCGNDQIASGALYALQRRGVRAPDDVAIIGFDNWSIFAEETRPALTTVDMRLRDLGRLAGARLVDMIAGTVEHGTVYLPCRLVIRDSCGAHGE